MIQPIKWKGDHILILDQTKLPEHEKYLICRDVESVIDAINRLAVRGAPALGVIAAMAVALEAGNIKTDSFREFYQKFTHTCSRIFKTRPTAVNIDWALERLKYIVLKNRSKGIHKLKKLLVQEADSIYREDIATNKLIGQQGKEIIPDGASVLTYCNAGSLATAGYGTALGVIRAAAESGKKVFVVACETRPLLQGARLTAWELKKDRIPFTLITDSTAGYYMKRKGAGLVIVGADRIALNGDTANKIGSYMMAVLAKMHGIPFYVAAPLSTIDQNIKSGADIPIEERSAREITHIGKQRIAPEGVTVWNPAFDVVPARYITGIITQKGIIRPPFKRNIQKALAGC